jgi:hypothetical protein
MASDRGVLFVATGQEYVVEASDCAERIKEIRPSCPIALVTDVSPVRDVFDREITIEDPSYSLTDKVAAVGKTPFEKTLFLDTDTFVVDGSVFDELWDLLERVPVAAAFDIARDGHTDTDEVASQRPPPSFPMLNTGVLAYRRSAVDPFLDRWRSLHEQYAAQEPNINDQIAFRRALWETGVEHAVLPPEYNFIAPSPQFAAEEVRILHGKVGNPREVVRAVNKRTPVGGRAYHPVYTDTDAPEIRPWVAGANEHALLRATRQSLREFGPVKTGLYVLLGPNPIAGRARLRRFRELRERETTVKAVWEAVRYVRK